MDQYCPICKKSLPLDNPVEGSFFPFCSERCRLIDLGKWIKEEYRIPGGKEDDGSGGDESKENNPEGE